MDDIVKNLRRLNALTSLGEGNLRLIREMQPAFELARRHQEAMQPLVDSARKYAEAMRPMLETARRYEDAIRPALEAAHQHHETFRRMSDTLQIAAPALELATQVQLSQVRLAESIGKTMALNGVVNESHHISQLADRWRATFDSIGNLEKLVPTNVFTDIQRTAESLRLSMPTFPVFQSTLHEGSLSADLTDAVERFRLHAESIANNPDAGIEDVTTLVSKAEAVNAAAPVEARPRLNGYLVIALLWVLDKAAEDPAKEAIHNAIAVLILVLTTVVPPDLPPRPVVSMPSSISRDAGGPAITAPRGDSPADGLPDLIQRAGPDAERLTLGFLNGIRNTNTRQAYEAAVGRFADWCDDRNLELSDITPFVIRAYVRQMQREYAVSTVKQHLAAIRLLFDHLVVGGVLELNPATDVRTSREGVRNAPRQPPIGPDEARQLLESVRESDGAATRDRALLSVIASTGAGVSAVVGMNVGDYFSGEEPKRMRLRSSGGSTRLVSIDQKAEECLDAYLEAAGIAAQSESPLWRTMSKERRLSDRRMSRVDVFRMIRRRQAAAAVGQPSAVGLD